MSDAAVLSLLLSVGKHGVAGVAQGLRQLCREGVGGGGGGVTTPDTGDTVVLTRHHNRTG